MSPLADPIDEAKRIMRIAQERRVVLRLFGGVAFRFRSNSANDESLSRTYVDVDFMGHAKQSREIKQLFEELGYLPRDRFNAMQGYRRLIFNDLEHQRRVDIFLDVFEMCHKFNFKDRLELDVETLTLADLLVTKLQIVEINEKDLKDMLSLFADHDIGEIDSRDLINAKYLAKLSSEDWGIYKTFTLNLDKLLASLDMFKLNPHQRTLTKSRIEQLKLLIDRATKSLKWKMRAKVGEKVQWYELPEADKEVVDSRIANANSNPSSL